MNGDDDTRVSGARGGVMPARGYANPMRKVLANLLMTRGELRREEARTGG